MVICYVCGSCDIYICTCMVICYVCGSCDISYVHVWLYVMCVVLVIYHMYMYGYHGYMLCVCMVLVIYHMYMYGYHGYMLCVCMVLVIYYMYMYGYHGYMLCVCIRAYTKTESCIRLFVHTKSNRWRIIAQVCPQWQSHVKLVFSSS